MCTVPGPEGAGPSKQSYWNDPIRLSVPGCGRRAAARARRHAKRAGTWLELYCGFLRCPWS